MMVIATKHVLSSQFLHSVDPPTDKTSLGFFLGGGLTRDQNLVQLGNTRDNHCFDQGEHNMGPMLSTF